MSRRRSVLITGAGGQVGTELVAAFDGWDVTAADRAALDVGDRSQVLSAIHSLSPDAVVNGAAYSDVDGCESDHARAYRDNAMAVRWLQEGCRATGAHLCHISTDYVFDGTAERPYTEWDRPDPASMYGRSKLAGELELDGSATLVRTSWVFGMHGRNLVKTVVRLAAGDGPMRFVDDQVGCPTEAGELAATIRALVDDRMSGRFHVTNHGAMSWFDVARHVVAATGGDPERVEPIATAELDPPRPAPRPAFSVLAGVATELAGVPRPGDSADALARVARALT